MKLALTINLLFLLILPGLYSKSASHAYIDTLVKRIKSMEFEILSDFDSYTKTKDTIYYDPSSVQCLNERLIIAKIFLNKINKSTNNIEFLVESENIRKEVLLQTELNKFNAIYLKIKTVYLDMDSCLLSGDILLTEGETVIKVHKSGL